MLTADLQPLVRYSTLTDNEIKFYQDEGYLYLPAVVSSEDAAALRKEVVDVYENLGIPYKRLCRVEEGGDKLRQSSQYLTGSRLDRLINGEEYRSIASQLMGGPSSLYLPFTAVKHGGGGGTFHFHQDNQYTRFDGPGLNLWMALEEMRPENGCLEVVPRSHLRGTAEAVQSPDGDDHKTVKITPEKFLPIRMRAGDVIAFTRLTIHGSGRNTTAEARLAYAVQFHRDDVTATWDGQTKKLKGANRWDTKPKTKIEKPVVIKSLDGH